MPILRISMGSGLALIVFMTHGEGLIVEAPQGALNSIIALDCKMNPKITRAHEKQLYLDEAR